ncbi:DUF4214 domain-containing protein [Devosia sp. 919]|uniref:DUF4214 domain-containing protein n=1 Tax=Devosia sp. 919 TaxID=2726065 RepID=UPI0015551C08|nr:DUF4214 domain-containing protein [Devosia sp. 919]
MASIQGVYVALFGRPADPGGLAFYNGLTNNGQDLSAIGNLAGEPEYLDRFANAAPEEIISAIYQSLFNREPDAAGLAYYTAELAAGDEAINTIAIKIMDGATGSDLTVIQNKIASADIFTEALDTPQESQTYTGAEAAELGRDYLAEVDEEAGSVRTPSEAVRFFEAIGTGRGATEYDYGQLYATDPDNIGNFYLSGESADNMLRAISFLENENVELALDVRTSSGGEPDPVDYEDGERITVFEVEDGQDPLIAYAVGMDMDETRTSLKPDLTRDYVFKLLVDQDESEGVEWQEFTLSTEGGGAPIYGGAKVSPYVWKGEDGSVLTGDGGQLGVTQGIRDFFAGTISAGDRHDVRLEMYERGPGSTLGDLVSEAHIQLVGVPDV